MRLQDFPSRLDPEMITTHLATIGWPLVEVEKFFEIDSSPETPKLLVSHYSYKMCGEWVRPAYAKLSVETSVDFNQLAFSLMRFSFDLPGSLSVFQYDKPAGWIAFSYRFMLQSTYEHRAKFAEGCFVASLGAKAVRDEIERFHRLP